MSSRSNKSSSTALSASTRPSPTVDTVANGGYHHRERSDESSTSASSPSSCSCSTSCNVGHFINDEYDDSMIVLQELHRKTIVDQKTAIKVAKYVSKQYHALLESDIFQQLQQQMEQENQKQTHDHEQTSIVNTKIRSFRD